MRKIILGSVTLLSLFLAGCSNQGSEAKQTEQGIEKQASTTTESPESDSNSEKLNTTDSTDRKIPELQNKTAYEVFEREFKRQVLATDKDTKVTMNKENIVIQINLALSDEQITQAQPMVDGMHKIVTSGQEVLQEYDPDFKAPKLTVIDSTGKIIATEKDGKMVLEK
jgi:lipoprotein